VTSRLGKPRAEQDQAEMEALRRWMVVRPFRFGGAISGRSLETFGNKGPREMIASFGSPEKTEFGL